MTEEHYHFIGIGGIGMSGLARLLLQEGKRVSGSDRLVTATTERLEEEGAQVFIGQKKEQVASEMTVVYSSGITKENPEYQAAVERGCTLWHRSDLLASLMGQKRALSVAGTHGKTTTSALLSWVLMQAGRDPSYAVGGVLPQVGTNAARGVGEHFVAETDESDGTLTKYHSYGAILTSIDLDHMDYYKNEPTLLASFRTFTEKVAAPDCLLWCGDDARLCSLELPGVSYGFSEECQLRAERFTQKGWSLFIDCSFEGRLWQNVEVSLVGKHNVYNALAVLGLCVRLGLSEEEIRKGLASFEGVKRRMEKKGEVQGVLVIDDYAHHPAEVQTTLEGLRRVHPERRIVAVLQPHRYTRTRDCLEEYRDAFAQADALIVTDIYAAGEQPLAGSSPQAVAGQVENCPSNVVSRSELLPFLQRFVRSHDIVITLGAGDITHVAGQLVPFLQQEGVQKWRVGVVYGGPSLEHEIAVQSARFVWEHLHTDHYEVSRFLVGEEEGWSCVSEESERIEAPLSGAILDKLLACDLLFPVFHGPFGEDGTIQGFFETLNKPFVGCSAASSVCCMDKAIAKAVVQSVGVPVVPYVAFSQLEWQEGSTALLERARGELSLPLYVKAVHLGSSFGVQRVEKWTELRKVVETLFSFDDKILIEEGVEGREIEVGVLGSAELLFSEPGEVFSKGGVRSFDEKYGESDVGDKAVADLPKEKVREFHQTARRAYRALQCEGLARIDFFLKSDGTIVFNEANPMPGMTPWSLFPKMCAQAGISGNELMDRVVISALWRERGRM